MRVAFVLNCFPAVSETFILRQISGLLDLGHDVRIFAETRGHGPLHPEVERHDLLGRTHYLGLPDEVAVYELPVFPIWGKTWSPESGTAESNLRRLVRTVPAFLQALFAHPRLAVGTLRWQEYGYQAASLSALGRLSSMAGHEKCDVIHAHFGPVGSSFRFLRELWQAPLVVSFHGYDFSRTRSGELPRYAKLFEASDAITVHSDFAANRLVELGCPSSRLVHLPCGVDLDQFPYREHVLGEGEPIKLLTVGRLVEKKGVEFSVRALAALRDFPRAIRYDIVGDGPLGAPLRDLVATLGLEDRVIFHGAQNGEYVRRLLEQAHVFALTCVTAGDGETEGTPVSLLEAQACGLPVVSSYHSGIPEIVLHGQSGLLSEERDVAGIAENLGFLLRNPELCARFGQEGRRHVQMHHDIGALNLRLAQLYERLATSFGVSRNQARGSTAAAR
ncbi:MAG TPA: glycosyltransferase [Thermoanaerobaculia bacterium]|nr:glycosyltransferase [Thermoanaerobaculia bacterium]